MDLMQTVKLSEFLIPLLKFQLNFIMEKGKQIERGSDGNSMLIGVWP